MDYVMVCYSFRIVFGWSSLVTNLKFELSLLTLFEGFVTRFWSLCFKNVMGDDIFLAILQDMEQFLKSLKPEKNPCKNSFKIFYNIH